MAKRVHQSQKSSQKPFAEMRCPPPFQREFPRKHSSIQLLRRSVQRANPKYSDFLILCGSHIFLAHKAIVCSQSDFFAKVFDSHFSVGYRVASSSSLTRKPSDRGIAGSLHGENQALRPSAGRPSAPRLPLFKRLHILSGLRFSYIILSRRTKSTGGSCWLVQDLMLQ